MNDLLQQLQEPFPPAAITWKPGASKGDKCMAMAYGDLRTYMERLDQVCGLDWSVRYEPWGNERIIACVTIAGVTRSSIGEYGKQDEQNNIEGTVAEAQAFKRACAMFGLGRYLYDLPSVWVPFDAGARKISAEGQAQLDARYKAWYAKTMAERKAQRQNASPPAQQAPAAIEAATVDGDALFDTEAQGTPPHNHFWGVGQSVFGPDWNIARGWLLKKWTEKVTPDKVRSSSSKLSDDEKMLLAEYMQESALGLQKAWAKQRAVEITKAQQPVAEAA